jgi:demethylmenaquinone methyltransferase/2-methoxy-6-polyprenyl-1,4-benzoquinol methylase
MSEIKVLFDEIADKYDFTNHVLSLGLHRQWNRRFVKKALEGSPTPGSILDLCAGTGEITSHLLKVYPNASYTLVDFSANMLGLAKERLNGSTINYLLAPAEETLLPANSFDLVTIAYGIRNIPDPGKVLSECFRLLQPGGKLAILELTRPSSNAISLLHNFYLSRIVPLLGVAVTQNYRAYQHLKKSVLSFMTAQELTHLMQEKGFTGVIATPYHFGTVTALFGIKPLF